MAKDADSTYVLFVGNSYTFGNDLPALLARLAQSGGHGVETGMVASGGWRLSQHAASQQTLDQIASRTWDVVVLQEQSVIPSVASQRTRQMLPAARALDQEIRAAGARTVLFMTWGRRDGLAREGFEDYAAMQAALAEGYTQVADELADALVAPVGLAWQNALRERAGSAFWADDGSHPTLQGSYLAACVFYAVLLEQSPEGASYVAGLPEDMARFLQCIAAETVLGAPAP